jgi:hypothetical protein
VQKQFYFKVPRKLPKFQGGLCKSSVCLLRWAAAWQSRGRRRAPPPACLGRQGDKPPAAPLLPVILSLSLSVFLCPSPSIPCEHPKPSSPAVAFRHRSRPPRARPNGLGAPLILPLASLQRNRRGAPYFIVGVAVFPAAGPSSAAPIHRLPASPVPAEHASICRVSPRSFPRPSSSRFCAVAPPRLDHRRPLAPWGEVEPGLWPSRLGRHGHGPYLANVAAEMASGPWYSHCGSNRPQYKKSLRVILIPGNFRIWVNLVKCITNSLFIRKLCIIYQNVHKIEIYLLVSKSCMIDQLWTLSKIEESIVPFVSN